MNIEGEVTSSEYRKKTSLLDRPFEIREMIYANLLRAQGRTYIRLEPSNHGTCYRKKLLCWKGPRLPVRAAGTSHRARPQQESEVLWVSPINNK